MQTAVADSLPSGAFSQVESGMPGVPELIVPKIELSASLTGEAADVTVSFTTFSELPADGQVAVLLPNFQLCPSCSAATISSVVGIDGTHSVSEGDSDHLTLFVTRVGGSVVARFTLVSFVLSGVTNRHWAGVATLGVETLNALGNFTFDSSAQASNVTIVQGAIVGAGIALSDRRTGVETNVTVFFTLSSRNGLPADGLIVILFDGRMDVSILQSDSAVIVSGMDGVLSTDVDGMHVTMTRSGGTAVLADSEIVVLIQHVRNPLLVNTTGPVQVELATNEGDLIDEDLNLLAADVAPGNLTDTAVTLSDYRALIQAEYTVTFTTGAVGLPIGSTVIVTFPDTTTIDANSIASGGATSVLGVSGSHAANAAGQTVSIIVSGNAAVDPYGVVSLTIPSGLQNGYTGPSGTYRIQTIATDSGLHMEEELEVPENTFVDARLIVNRITVTDERAGSVTEVSIDLTLISVLNKDGVDGGLIKISLPDGFFWANPPTIVTQSTTAPDGFLAVYDYNDNLVCESRSWLTCGNITMSLSGGYEWTYNTEFSFTLAGLKNRPFSGDSGRFAFVTTGHDNQLIGAETNGSVTLVPNNLTSVSLTPESYITDTEEDMVLNITTSNVVPGDCIFLVTLPDAYTYEANSVTITASSVDGVFSISTEPREVEVHRSSRDPTGAFEISGLIVMSRTGGTLLPEGSTILLTFGALLKRESSGSTGTFDVVMKTDDEILMDTAYGVSDHYFVYLTPEISELSRYNSPKSGGISITIYGNNYGPIQYNEFIVNAPDDRGIAVGSSSCTTTVWTADTAMVCVLAAGLGGGLNVSVYVEGQVDLLTNIFTYDIPVVIRTDPSNMPSSSSEEVAITIIGSGFGAEDFGALAAVGDSACENSQWISDTALMCVAAVGNGGSMRAVVTVGEQLGTITEVLSYDKPLIELGSSAVLNLAPAEATSITVHGKSFALGFSESLRIGTTACESTLWNSDSSLQCKAGAGTGGSLRIAVTVGVLVGTVTEATSYDLPSLTSLSPVPNLATTGGIQIELMGSNFGMQDYTPSGRTGLEGCETSVWASDSALYCRTGFGAFGTVAATITAGVRVGSMTEVVSYNAPALSGVPSRGNTASTGSVSMTVVGNNIAINDYSQTARVGGTTCESSEWESDSSVRCLSAGGVVSTRPVTVTAGVRVGTTTEAASYDVASPSGAVRGNAASTGSVSMTVSGSGMGVSDYTGSARVGGTACETTLGWESDSSVRCLSAGGVYGTLRVSVTAGGRAGTTTEAASYDVASPSGAVRGNAASTGSVSMTVSGSGMGVSDYTGSARVGGTACETTLGWESDSSVRCLSAGGVYGTLRVSVTAGGRAGTTTEAASYDVASPSGAVRGNAASTGSVSMTVSGSGMGVSDYTGSARVGGTACETTLGWESDSSVRCLSAGGVYGTLRVSVTAGGRAGTTTEAASYDVALPSGVVRGNAASTGSVSMTVSGSGMGVSDYTGSARVGGTACETTLGWESDSSVRCLSAGGVYGTLRVSVTAGGRAGTTTEAASYDVASPSGAVRGNAASTGSVSMTVSGSGMGVSDYTGSARVGGTACETTLGWESDSSVRCLSAGGVYGTLRVSVTAGGRAGTTTEAASYDVASLSSVRGATRRARGR